MFLNLSNHPLEKWSPAQLLAARELGGGAIDTIKFPNVPPAASTEEVAEMAKSLTAMIVGAFVEPGVAMVQGEFSMTWEMTRRLLALGWSGVVATSDRKVIEGADGTKTVTFEFVQFRAVRN
jgi:hypothetical protein